MFWRGKSSLIPVSRETASSWPQVLAAAGYSVDRNARWARKADSFCPGLPYGDAIGRNGEKVSVCAWDNRDGKIRAMQAGIWIQLLWKPRFQATAEQIERLLPASGRGSVFRKQ